MFTPIATVMLLLCSLSFWACVDLPQLPERDAAVADLQPGAPATAVPPTKTLRLGSWNVRKLGLEGGKDLARVAAIIDQQLDLVALVELMWSPENGAFVELLTRLGPGWGGHVTSSARPNLPYEHAELYAVAYRTALVSPCSEQPALRYVQDNDGSGTSHEPDLFLREPAIGCYRVASPLGGLDLALGVYHARWGTGNSAEIATEVQNVDSVFTAMQQLLPGEQQLYLLGDFNLVPHDLTPLTKASDRTRGVGSTLDTAGRISSHLYDHLLAFGAEANASLADDAVVVDVRGEANDLASFREQVSDHLPIVARLPLSTDRD